MGKSIGEYSLVNDEKVERALHGVPLRAGGKLGGVGDDATEEAVLAEYDRLGGLVTKNGVKVKTGAFYDFQKKCPRAEPEVSFMTEVDGEILEVSEEEAVVLKAAKEKTDALKAKKRKKEIIEYTEEKLKKIKKSKTGDVD